MTSNTLPHSATVSASGKGLPPSSGAAAVEPSSLHATPRMVVNHLLTYASFYRNRSTENNLLKVLTGFYSAGEINEGKKCLLTEFLAELADYPLKVERRSSSVRSAHHAEAEDIIGLLNHIDSSGSLIMLNLLLLSWIDLHVMAQKNIIYVRLLTSRFMWRQWLTIWLTK